MPSADPPSEDEGVGGDPAGSGPKEPLEPAPA